MLYLRTSEGGPGMEKLQIWEFRGKSVTMCEIISTMTTQPDLQHVTDKTNQELYRASMDQIDGNLDYVQKNAGTQVTSLKKAWLIARPIIHFLQTVLAIKPAWHDALTALISQVDAIVDQPVQTSLPVNMQNNGGQTTLTNRFPPLNEGV